MPIELEKYEARKREFKALTGVDIRQALKRQIAMEKRLHLTSTDALSRIKEDIKTMEDSIAGSPEFKRKMTGR